MNVCGTTDFRALDIKFKTNSVTDANVNDAYGH